MPKKIPAPKIKNHPWETLKSRDATPFVIPKTRNVNSRDPELIPKSNIPLHNGDFWFEENDFNCEAKTYCRPTAPEIPNRLAQKVNPVPYIIPAENMMIFISENWLPNKFKGRNSSTPIITSSPTRGKIWSWLGGDDIVPKVKEMKLIRRTII